MLTSECEKKLVSERGFILRFLLSPSALLVLYYAFMIIISTEWDEDAKYTCLFNLSWEWERRKIMRKDLFLKEEKKKWYSLRVSLIRQFPFPIALWFTWSISSPNCNVLGTRKCLTTFLVLPASGFGICSWWLASVCHLSSSSHGRCVLTTFACNRKRWR